MWVHVIYNLSGANKILSLIDVFIYNLDDYGITNLNFLTLFFGKQICSKIKKYKICEQLK